MCGLVASPVRINRPSEPVEMSSSVTVALVINRAGYTRHQTGNCATACVSRLPCPNPTAHNLHMIPSGKRQEEERTVWQQVRYVPPVQLIRPQVGAPGFRRGGAPRLYKAHSHTFRVGIVSECFLGPGIYCTKRHGTLMKPNLTADPPGPCVRVPCGRLGGRAVCCARERKR